MLAEGARAVTPGTGVAGGGGGGGRGVRWGGWGGGAQNIGNTVSISQGAHALTKELYQTLLGTQNKTFQI